MEYLYELFWALDEICKAHSVTLKDIFAPHEVSALKEIGAIFLEGSRLYKENLSLKEQVYDMSFEMTRMRNNLDKFEKLVQELSEKVAKYEEMDKENNVQLGPTRSNLGQLKRTRSASSDVNMSSTTPKKA